MNAQELRAKAKTILTSMMFATGGIDGNSDVISVIVLQRVDDFIDCLIAAAVAEIVEGYQVDVPNTGYFGVIVKQEG